MRQHFELGSFLRSRYKGFLNDSYDRHEVGVTNSLINVLDKESLAMLVLIELKPVLKVLLSTDLGSQYRF